MYYDYVRRFLYLLFYFRKFDKLKDMELKRAKLILKRTKNTFEKIAQRFSQTRALPRKEMCYFVKKYVKQKMRILDIAAGNGLLFELLKDKKVKYLGIDSSKRLILIARKKHPKAKFIVGDILDFKFKSKNFDLIFAFAFLHHLPGKELRLKFLKKVYNILKPGGIFISTSWFSFAQKKMKYIKKFNTLWRKGKSDFDFNDALVPWKNSKGKVLGELYYHRFTFFELRRLFKDSGFKIIELFYEKNGRKTTAKNADNLCIVVKRSS